MAARGPLDLCTAREAGPVLAVLDPVGQRGAGADEPEQGVGEVDPDGVLHALDVGVALGVFVDEELGDC